MKCVVKLFFILVLLSWQTVVLSAADLRYYFKHLTIEDGLSQNSVLSILQDQKGFMWFGTKDGLNRYDGNSIKIYKHDDKDPSSLGNNFVWKIYEHSDGNIWVGTDRGIYILDKKTETFRFFDDKIKVPVLDIKADRKGNVWIAADRLFRYSIKENKLYEIQNGNNVFAHTWSIYIDDDDQIWVSMHGLGIRKYAENATSYTDITKDESGSLLSSVKFSQLEGFDNNYILGGTINSNLRVINKITNEVSPLKVLNSNIYVRCISSIGSELWVGGESGLYIIDMKKGTSTHITQNIFDKYALSDNAIYSIYQDREGGIWIGTYFGGVNYIPKHFNFFEKYYPIQGLNSINGERISGLCEDSEGNIWVGTEDAGLNKFNPTTKIFEHFPVQNSGGGISYHNVHDIIRDGDKLWIGLFNNGINVFDLKTKRVVKHYHKGSTANALDNNDIFALHKDRGGNIWVGTSSGAFLFDRKTESFVRQAQLGSHFVSDILEDQKGRIWFTTYNAGVFRYNPRTKESRNYLFEWKNPRSVCHYKINCVFEDSKGRIWFAGESGGICVYEEKTDDFKRYGFSEGFSSDVIYAIQEDKHGNLWLSSNAGLMKFSLEDNSVVTFNVGNGLLCNQFNYKSGLTDSSGKMYFGSINGLVAFAPDSFMINKYISPIAITGFKVLNADKTFSHEKNDKSNGITLSYDMSSFSIDFAALSYSAPEQNRYAYRMLGLEDKWIYLNKAQTIIFSNLPSGKYQFQIKGSNNDGVWNENYEYLDITIRPPFWKTVWAYIFYTITLVALVYYFIYSYHKRVQKKAENERVLFEKEKETEMFDAKIGFFTNIAHEVRTPLTLIKSPLEYIMKNGDLEKKEVDENLGVIQKNTDRLLLLINQLLDFRKTESKAFSLTFVKTDINDLLAGIFNRFELTAVQRSLKMALHLPDEIVWADVDKEALTKVVSNLFTNAIKYAKKKIEIVLTTTHDEFFIRVNSDGLLIAEEYSDKIFEPFFQIRNGDEHSSQPGSGIGLSLAKSLVELHKGKLILDKSKTDVNSFLIHIPINQEGAFIFNEDSVVDEELDDTIVTDHHQNAEARVLLVEDDEDMLAFMIDKLRKRYILFYAKNGQDALDILEKETINLVISDVMMPVMDGFALCKKIKQDINYSHIPVILLTAKNSVLNKIEGLDSGADAYIEKPFSLDYLFAQISNLFTNRQKLREAFAHSPFIATGTMAMNKADEEFLYKLQEVILKNISNPEFSVDHLASEMSMSRSSLLRKIKGVAEIPPNDFIKIVRLKRAAEILEEGKYKINEVCYLVGFSSSSYFTKAFKKQFGVLPKDFVKK